MTEYLFRYGLAKLLNVVILIDCGIRLPFDVWRRMV